MEGEAERLICVYASSSSYLDEKYYKAAEELGCLMAKSGFGLCFGGGRTGLMGACASGVTKASGRVVGIIPEALNRPGVAYPLCDELIIAPSMRKRKRFMEEHSCGFIALPGGFGTFEEILEIITLKQLAYHNKPIVILNFEGYYDNLLAQFETAFEEKFAMREAEKLYCIAEDAETAITYIREYCPQPLHDKIGTQVLGEKS